MKTNEDERRRTKCSKFLDDDDQDDREHDKDDEPDEEDDEHDKDDEPDKDDTRRRELAEKVLKLIVSKRNQGIFLKDCHFPLCHHVP